MGLNKPCSEVMLVDGYRGQRWRQQCNYLGHLVTLSLPTEPLVVQRVFVSANEDWLPMHKVACTFPYVEHPQSFSCRLILPLLGLWHIVTPWTHFFVEWNR